MEGKGRGGSLTPLCPLLASSSFLDPPSLGLPANPEKKSPSSWKSLSSFQQAFSAQPPKPKQSPATIHPPSKSAIRKAIRRNNTTNHWKKKKEAQLRGVASFSSSSLPCPPPLGQRSLSEAENDGDGSRKNRAARQKYL